MPTTTQQLRDINQQSVDLSPEWVERLKQVQIVAQSQTDNELPEIVLVSVPHAKPSTSDTQTQTVPRGHVDYSTRVKCSDESASATIQTDTATVDSFAFETVDTSTISTTETADAESTNRSEIDLVGFLSNYMDVSDLEIPLAETPSPMDTIHSTSAGTEFENATQTNQTTALTEEQGSDEDPTPLVAASSMPADSAPTNFVPAHKIIFDIDQLKMDERVTNLRINRLIDRILEKIPPVEPTSIVFGDSHPILDTAFATAQTAIGLVKRDLGPVLIIEADSNCNMLSKQFCPNEHEGLTEILENETSWQNLIYATSLDGLDFLPLGITNVAQQNINGNSCRQLIANLKKQYRNICICAGTFDSKMGKTLAAACDATYLVVDIATSDQYEVGQTCKLLHDCGARTLGCIAAEPR